jgi:hypothetical protein
MSVAGDTTYLASGLLEKIQSDAIIQMTQAGVTSQLVRKVYHPRADTITIQAWNTGTHQITSGDVGSVTDGSEVSASYLGSEKKTITLAPYAVRSDVYDDTIYSSQDDPAGPLGRILANAIAAHIDKTLNALFDGFSNAVGTSTAGLTVDNLFSAVSSIETNEGVGPFYGVFYPSQIVGDYGLSNDIVTSTQFGGSPSLQSQGLIDAYFQKVAGVEIFKSTQFTETSNAVKAGVFTRDALALGYSGPPSGIKVEKERAATYLRDIYVASSFFGVTECVDGWGVEVHTRTSAP